MPFLRSWALRSAVATALAALMLTAVAAPTSARAEEADAAAPATPEAVTPTSAVTPPASDAAAFCTRPTGRWWEDYAADGCAARVAGRTAATPLTPTELTWLDLGDLPAHADVDVDALGAELARYEAQVRAEAEAEAAAETARASTPAPQPKPRRDTTLRARQSGAMQWLLAPGQMEEISASCGYTLGTPADAAQQACLVAGMDAVGTRVGSGSSAAATGAPSPEPSPEYGDQEMSLETRIDEDCRTVTPRPSDDLMPGPEWDGYFRALAVCVDQQLPGYLARWEQEQAEQRARYEEDRRRAQPAWDRLRERQERARQEIRDRCPHGGWATPTKYQASSPDEIDYVVSCNPDPSG